MGSNTAFSKTAASFGNLGSDLKNSFTSIWKSKPAEAVVETKASGLLGFAKTLEEEVGFVMKDTGRLVGDTARAGGSIVHSVVGKPMLGAVGGSAKAAAKMAIWAVERPLIAGLGVVRMGVNGTGAAFKAAPKTMWGMVAVGLGATAAVLFGKRAETQSANYYQAQAAGLRAAAASQPAPYRLAEGEYAQQVEPLLKENAANGSFAEAAQQRGAVTTAAI